MDLYLYTIEDGNDMNNYDSQLQMLIETPKPIDQSRLAFERWLVQNRGCDHAADCAPLPVSADEVARSAWERASRG